MRTWWGVGVRGSNYEDIPDNADTKIFTTGVIDFPIMNENPYEKDIAIFDDERVLKEDWSPRQLPERQSELKEVRNALAPVTRGVNAHNLFIYGKTGQGKTVAVGHELNLLQEWADEKEEADLSVVKVSAHNQSTSYQLTAHLIKEIRGDSHKPSGIDQQSMFDLLYKELRELGKTIIIVIDEIDSIGTNDELLYELPRARKNGYLENQWISVIGISNNLQFRDNLSPKVKDSLYDSEIEFKPYGANQLESILTRRAERAFKDDTITDGVISLCSAFAAQDEGSARQAIRLLYKSGELALNTEADLVSEQHVRESREILERKRIEDGMRSLTRQDQLALLSIVALEAEDTTPVRTKQVYEKYKSITTVLESNQLVERRVRDHLQSLAMQGFIIAQTRRTGVQGGTHYIFELKTDFEVTLEILAEDEQVCGIIKNLRSNTRP